MNSKRVAVILILIFAFIMGCSRNYGEFRTQPESDSKVTKQELIDNWSDYNIRYNSVVIVFNPKNDDKKIIVNNYWLCTVEDQETWTQLVNGTKKLPKGYYNQVWGNEIREIWLPDNQLYGYVTHAPNELISAQMVDENTVRLFHSRSEDRRNH